MREPIDALYIRQSLDKQDSISVENQIEFCKYETRGGAYETYVDKGFSGKNTNRPAFTQMMQDVKAEKIKRVIVYKLDRISRSILDFANMMEIFQKYHVEFVSSTEKFDTSTPIGNAMLHISIVFAQLERETIQKRIADAYFTKSQKGYYMGGRVPYGFRLEKIIADGAQISRFTPEPAEMAQVRLIYELYAEPDRTLGDVLRELVNRGLAKKRGAAWCTARIGEIIRNPVYVKADMDVYQFFQSQGARLANSAADYIGANGVFLYKGENGAKTRNASDLAGRDAVLAPHEGVIDSALWLKCRRKVMNNRQSARTRKGKRTWLSGKIKCKKCGYAYVVIKSNAKAGRYFQCSGARYAIRCKGAGRTIYADELEARIAEELKKELKKLQNFSSNEFQAPSLPDNQSKMRMAEIDREIAALLDKVADANPTLLQYINNRVEELDREKLFLREKQTRRQANRPKEDTVQIADRFLEWEEISLEDKQKIADVFIQVIYVGEDGVEIQWKA